MDIGSVLGNIGFDFKVFIFNTINFAILIFLLKKFLFDKVTSVISERETLINSGLENAIKAEKDLEKANEKRKEILEEAKQKKKEILEQTNIQAQESIAQANEKAQKQYQYIINKANQDALSLKEKVMVDLGNNISKIVTKELEDKIVK